MYGSKSQTKASSKQHPYAQNQNPVQMTYVTASSDNASGRQSKKLSKENSKNLTNFDPGKLNFLIFLVSLQNKGIQNF